MARHQIDIWGEMCPIPIIKTQRHLKLMCCGDVLIMETDHSCTSRAIVVWAREQGHEIDEKEVANGIWRLELIKRDN